MAKLNVTAILILVLIIVIIDNSVRLARVSSCSGEVDLNIADLKARTSHASHSKNFNGDWSLLSSNPTHREIIQMRLWINGGNPYRCDWSQLRNPIRIPINAFADKTSSYRMFVHPPKEDGLISDTVFEHGANGAAFDHTIQWAMFKWLQAVSEVEKRDKLLILDVGANIGLHALYVAALGHEVHAFEPHPVNYPLLRCSALVNAFSGLIINEYGLADKEKTSCIEIEERNKGHAVINDKATESKDCIPLSLRTLDDYWTKVLKKRQIDFLKIDIEGYEFLVLQGGEEVFKTKPPKIMYLEWAPGFLTVNGLSSEEFLGWLDDHGYRVDLIDPQGRLQGSMTSGKVKEFVERYGNHGEMHDMLAVHSSFAEFKE